jgi:hypothetical protein
MRTSISPGAPTLLSTLCLQAAERLPGLGRLSLHMHARFLHPSHLRYATPPLTLSKCCPLLQLLARLFNRRMLTVVRDYWISRAAAVFQEIAPTSDRTRNRQRQPSSQPAPESPPQRTGFGPQLPKNMQDPWAVMGVTRQASQDEIKEQWRRLCKQHHPDLQVPAGPHPCTLPPASCRWLPSHCICTCVHSISQPKLSIVVTASSIAAR